MRALWITTGVCLALCFIMLGVLALSTGRANLGLAMRSLSGNAAYAMGLGYLALAPATVLAFLLGVDVGAKYHLRRLRNAFILAFAVMFLAAAALGAHNAFAGAGL